MRLLRVTRILLRRDNASGGSTTLEALAGHRFGIEGLFRRNESEAALR
jgi:hypothetical protein